MNRRVIVLLVAAALLLTAAVGVLVLNLERFQASFAWVERTNRVLHQIAATEIGFMQAESDQRGYVLTGDESYRQGYEHAKRGVTNSLAALTRWFTDAPDQSERLRELRVLRDARLDEFEQIIALGPARREEALAILATAKARHLTPLIAAKLDEMRRAEQALLAGRQQGLDRAANQMTMGAVILAVLAVLSTALGAYLFERNRAIAQLQAADRRTQELQSELLHVSRLSSMGEMASVLAHEINQPLMAIANYLQGSRRLIEQNREENGPVVKDALAKAAEQALRAGEVIRRLREFLARGENRKQVESLGKLVEEASVLALLAAKHHPVDFTAAVDPACDQVLVDGVQIQQVLINLIRNAIEAMQEAPRRALTVSSTSAPDGMVRVSVSDTGPGIAPEIAARLFEPFVTTKNGGLGVGLSISRTIVEAHGGKLEALPNGDGGATFQFTLYAAT